VEAGEVLAAIEGDSGSLEVLAPFTLEVVEVNELAEINLERIAEDPLEEGWLVKLRSRLEKTTET
jgi:glycine cleavage system H lipoate-binding protein